MWDNRCLLHKANGDYDMTQVRYLYRIMLHGDVPRVTTHAACATRVGRKSAAHSAIFRLRK